MPLLLVLVIATDLLGQAAPVNPAGQAAPAGSGVIGLGAGFSLTPRVDLVAGGDETTGDVAAGNVVGAGATSTQQRLNSYFYQILPSLSLNASGQHSVLQALYTFGFSEDKASPYGNTDSHVASVIFSGSLGRDWKINISDSFSRTSNLGAFNASLGNIASVPNAFNYLYYPSALNQISESNTVQVRTDYALPSGSTVSLTGSYALLKYPNGSEFAGELSNQQRASVGIAYRHRMSERDSWTVEYDASYMTFTDYPSTRAETVSAGYSHRFIHDLQFQVRAGPSYAYGPQTYTGGPQVADSYVSFDALASLSKTVKGSNINIFYQQTSGDATGLGAISDTRSAGFGLNRRVGGNLNVSTSISAFDLQGALGNVYNSRGVSASAMLTMPLNKTLSFNWGGQYQRYEQAAPFGFDEKRLFISLRYIDPGLWRSSR